jgi:hypothetical protein
MAKPIKDKLSEKLIKCPECGEWAHTVPSERVPEQSLRNCDLCESDFFIDYETTEFRTEGIS